MLGMMIAFAMILSYLETLIPPFVAIPGVKLGLANAATLLALYTLGAPSAVCVSLLRIGLSSLLFGNAVGFIYSISGGALSLCVAVLLKKSGMFSPVGISAAGGVAHNVGQVLAVMAVMGNAGLISYLPPLLISGVVFGVAVGVLSGILISRVSKIIEKKDNNK